MLRRSALVALMLLAPPTIAHAEPMDELMSEISSIFANIRGTDARRDTLDAMIRAGDASSATAKELAMAGLATAAMTGGNSPIACDYFRRGAELGHTAAMHMYGECYANAILTDNPTENIEKWYGRAAENGNWTSLCALGELRMIGRYLEKDPEKGLAECERAAENGSSNAQLTVGDAYTRGELVGQDYETAALWYEQALSSGNHKGARNLAFLHANGQFQQESITRARELAEFSAKRGDPASALVAADLVMRELAEDEATFQQKFNDGLGFRGFFWAGQAYGRSGTEDARKDAERILLLYRDLLSDEQWMEWSERAKRTDRRDM